MDTPGLHRMRMSHAEVERQRRQEVEELDAPTSNAVQRTCGWRYSGMAPLGVSPSERDGLDPAKVDKWRREFLHLIYKAGTALKMCACMWCTTSPVCMISSVYACAHVCMGLVGNAWLHECTHGYL
eukprot:138740-Chlamydomonas_euryale.AAC.4